MAYQTDIWRVALVKAPIHAWLEEDFLPIKKDIVFLPQALLPPFDKDFCFHADPFGFMDDDYIHIFTEYYDYRQKKGKIHHFLLDHNCNLLGSQICLDFDYHLSYPFLFHYQDAVYIMPEMHRANRNRQIIYKGVFQNQIWQFYPSQCEFPDYGLIDASMIKWQDKYWLFYSKSKPEESLHIAKNEAKNWPLRVLYLSYADSPFGPWHDHPQNPIIQTLDGARMGGTPFIHDGKLYLPCQNAEASYGGSLRLWQIDMLSCHDFKANKQRLINPLMGFGYDDGLHTLSSCGEYSLIDMKHIETSNKRGFINFKRRLRRLF